MDTEKLKAQTGFISFGDLVATQESLRQEFNKSHENLRKDVNYKFGRADQKIDNLDEKVDTLNTVVLPLLELTRQSAEATKEMSKDLKVFVLKQSETNDNLVKTQSAQQIEIVGLQHVTATLGEKKKSNVQIVLAFLSIVGIFIGGLFSLAPTFFN